MCKTGDLVNFMNWIGLFRKQISKGLIGKKYDNCMRKTLLLTNIIIILYSFQVFTSRNPSASKCLILWNLFSKMNDIFNIFSPKYYICVGSRAYISSAKWIFDKTINLRLEPGELCAKEKKLISRTQLLVTEEAQESNKFQFLKTVNSLQTAKQNSCLCQLCYNADKKNIFTNENFAFVITVVLQTFTKDPL